MVEAYLKQLIQNGSGKFTVTRISAEGEEALNVKRDVYLADDWQDATKEEYDAQNAAVDPSDDNPNNVESHPAGEQPAPESAPEAPVSEPEASEAPSAPESTPEASPEAPAAPEEAPAPEPES
jgi:hypothetical protein